MKRKWIDRAMIKDVGLTLLVACAVWAFVLTLIYVATFGVVGGE